MEKFCAHAALVAETSYGEQCSAKRQEKPAMPWAPLLLLLSLLRSGQSADQSATQPTQLSRTNADYNAEELLSNIFDPITSRAAGYGLIKFENQPAFSQQTSASLVTFEGHAFTNKLKFEDQPQEDQNSVYIGADAGDLGTDSQNQIQGEAFQDSSTQKPQNSGQKKRRRRRRRRKPRLQALGAQPSGFQVPVPGFNPYGPGLPTQFHRPPAGALESIMVALTAVAQHDDLQCVPRLLCEALGGATSGAANGAASGVTSALLKAVTTIQPILTMFGGLGGSPLAVFGRAALLSANGPDACRPAYPACPADPQQVVHYLNNHNGGFFRFFNSPPTPPAGQNYGADQPDPSGLGQNYGLYKPDPNDPDQNYDIYKPDQTNLAQNYGLYQPYPAINAHPDFYSNMDQQYGYGHRYGYKDHRYDNPQKYVAKYGLNHLSNTENKGTKISHIEKRILNNPGSFNEISEPSSEPGTDGNHDKKAKQFKFPEEIRGTRQAVEPTSSVSGFKFPGSQSNRNYDVSPHRDHAQAANADGDRTQEGVQVVYVVRGNGDPSHPEVVRLRPGETLR